MKLIIVLGMVEHEKEIAKMFKESNIPIYSKVDIEGIKSGHKQVDLSNWFGSDEDTDLSIMFFAFIANGNAEELYQKVEVFNANEDRIAPLHAFQLPVEKFI
ncbi:hypothetical protein FRY74_12110 [Vicingus serpentipes]|uniref:Uncharacterized protein n=1 Tax=Vicingus serpentipes TaxID=1926625 RepID=A0A5C6RQP3_9FLAO|nr:hypothetical protein [Vicingus serpentipes]TXB63990.1 hypothetical protein FRY74_12110 [Vicingus serpentipes]